VANATVPVRLFLFQMILDLITNYIKYCNQVLLCQENKIPQSECAKIKDASKTAPLADMTTKMTCSGGKIQEVHYNTSACTVVAMDNGAENAGACVQGVSPFYD
jgi:hypothetical protein